MTGGVLNALGGLGLFLLGMAVMTDGLKSLAHTKLRNLLARSTRSPLSGTVTGAMSTAIVQSSSATTVAAVGLVNAGLLTFPEALGIILGANLGTTVTGWLLALLGFKLKLAELMLPVILLGVLMRLFGNGRVAALGYALAGFGLIFVGISFMQDGLKQYTDVVMPERFPSGDTFGGRALLVLLGAVITLIIQSSSAGVAMALVALNSGSLTFSQAASMVIGMDVGTTVTALMATIGGKVQARRTGLAHVIFNVFIAIGAFALLTPYMRALDRFNIDEPELALVGFHTLFNLFGLIIVLPFAKRFAALVVRLVPERGNPLTQRLDLEVQRSPELALDAVQATICDLVTAVFLRLTSMLRREMPAQKPSLSSVEDAMRQTESYLRDIPNPPGNELLHQRYEASVHILDHLRRLLARLTETERLEIVLHIDEAQEYIDRLADAAELVASDPIALDDKTSARFHTEYRELKALEKPFRVKSIRQAAAGEFGADIAISRTDAIRWLRRQGYHVWRVIRQLKYYRNEVRAAGPPDDAKSPID